MKDLPDIALLATIRSLEAARLRAAIEQTFSFGATHDRPKALPEPPPEWREPYASMAFAVPRIANVGETVGVAVGKIIGTSVGVTPDSVLENFIPDAATTRMRRRAILPDALRVGCCREFSSVASPVHYHRHGRWRLGTCDRDSPRAAPTIKLEVSDPKPHIDVLRRLREATGAPFVECRAALAESGGDEGTARARVRDIAIERVAAHLGCAKEHASAGYARFGWDLDRAIEEARRQMLEADPVLAAQLRRKWQLETLHAASRHAHLIPIVHEADLRTPLATLLGSLAELEGLIDDRTGTDLGHAFDDAPDWMTSILACIEATGMGEAIDLVKLVSGGTRDQIGRVTIDFAAAEACLSNLFPILRDELQRVTGHAPAT